MTKITFFRVQEVEIKLERQPTDEELKILLGKSQDESMFDLPEDLIDFEKEEVIGEDYSCDFYVYIPEVKVDL